MICACGTNGRPHIVNGNNGMEFTGENKTKSSQKYSDERNNLNDYMKILQDREWEDRLF